MCDPLRNLGRTLPFSPADGVLDPDAVGKIMEFEYIDYHMKGEVTGLNIERKCYEVKITGVIVCLQN